MHDPDPIQTAPPSRDPWTFALGIALLLAFAVLMGVLFYGLLQMMQLPEIPGRLAGPQAKLQALLPVAAAGVWLVGALAAATGWWKLRGDNGGGRLLGFGLLAQALLGVGLALVVRTQQHSLSAARRDAQDARKAHQEFREYITSDINRQRNELRDELKDSDKVRSQANRLLAQLKREDPAFKGRLDLMDSLQKLHASLRGGVMENPEMFAIENHLGELYGGKVAVPKPLPASTPVPTPVPTFAELRPTPVPSPVPTATPVLPGIARASEALGFRSRFPEGWRITEQPEFEALIASAPLADARQGGRATVTVLRQASANDPAAVLVNFLETFTKSVEDFRELDRGQTPLPGAGLAAYVRCAYRQAGQETQALLFGLAGTRHGYVIQCAAPRADFARYEEPFMIPVLFFRAE